MLVLLVKTYLVFVYKNHCIHNKEKKKGHTKFTIPLISLFSMTFTHKLRTDVYIEIIKVFMFIFKIILVF